MQFTVPITLVLIFIALMIRLQGKETQIQKFETQMKELQDKVEKAHERAFQLGTIYDAIWDCANTIHLYAALSEEESRSELIKEKQAEILRLSEKIVQLTR